MNREGERAAFDMGSPDNDDDAMRARLKDLTSAIDTQRKGATPTDSGPSVAPPDGIGSAMNLGFRAMSEFVVAVLLAAVIGWAIDHWLGSSPIALIVFIALGTAAGFWNIYKIAARPTGRGMMGR